MVQLEVERPRIKAHPGLLLIVTGQFLYPVREVAPAADNPSTKPHVLSVADVMEMSLRYTMAVRMIGYGELFI
jgi:hypothetical protein